MAEIFVKCGGCENELPLRENHFDVRTEDDQLRIYRQCEICGFENEEIIYLG